MSEASKRMRQTYEVTGDIWFERAADEIERQAAEIARLQRLVIEQGQEIAITRERDEALDAEIAGLRAALEVCAAPFSSQSGTVMRAAMDVSYEFQRRIDVAAMALGILEQSKEGPNADK